MKSKNEEFDIEIIYKFKNNIKDKIQIFGSTFVKNNKDKLDIKYNFKKYNMTKSIK